VGAYARSARGRNHVPCALARCRRQFWPGAAVAAADRDRTGAADLHPDGHQADRGVDANADPSAHRDADRHTDADGNRQRHTVCHRAPDGDGDATAVGFADGPCYRHVDAGGTDADGNADAVDADSDADAADADGNANAADADSNADPTDAGADADTAAAHTDPNRHRAGQCDGQPESDAYRVAHADVYPDGA